MHCFLILNPKSRGGKSEKRFKQIKRLLDHRGIRYDFEITQSLDHARQLSFQANKKIYDTIVAVGGDGTINSVLNGFYDKEGKKISNASMGVIYTGTSPDFCKSYHIPLKLTEAVDIIAENNLQKISVGKITFLKKNLVKQDNQAIDLADKAVVRYFACCANMGLGATLAKNANSGIRKYAGDFMGTFLSFVPTLVSYRKSDFMMVKDGKKTIVKNLYNLSVGRTRYIASGIKLENSLDNNNYHFYCLTITNLNLKNLPGVFKKIYSGKTFQNDYYITLDYCDSIEIYSNTRSPEIEFDGDPAGYLPCRIELAQDPLDLVVNNDFLR
jgi:diacylglycerol kinase family enzyme